MTENETLASTCAEYANTDVEQCHMRTQAQEIHVVLVRLSLNTHRQHDNARTYIIYCIMHVHVGINKHTHRNTVTAHTCN